MARYYRATFEEQLTGSHLEGFNCAAASGAMLADQATLGIVDPPPDRVRALTGDFVGGLTQASIGNALDKLNVDTTVYDSSDNLSVLQLVRFLRAGRFAVIAGDYGALPAKYQGASGFDGDHSVFAHAVHGDGDAATITIGDPLSDGRRPGIPKGYTTWPLDVMKRYVKAFDAHTVGGIHCTLMNVHRVKPRSQIVAVEVHEHPRDGAEVIHQLSGRRSIVTGGTVDGGAIRGNERWFKVWVPGRKSRIGYIHSSVVDRI